jgi:GH3 auxin-responsive promoter
MTTAATNLAASNLLRSFADSRTVQREVLHKVVAANKSCEFGRRHAFASIQSVSDFRRAVPVAEYENFRNDIGRMSSGEAGVLTSEPVRRFFITSGSTSKPKYVPVTPSFVRAKSYAFQTFWNLVRESYPGVDRGSVIFNFSDSGREHRTSGGLLCSSESSFWNACWRVAGGKARCPFPSEIMYVMDSEARYYAITRILLETDITVLMTLNPSTLLLLGDVIHREGARLIEDIERGGVSKGAGMPREMQDYIAAHFPGNPSRARKLENVISRAEGARASEIWPNLQLVVCWRSPMTRSYLDLLGPFLGSTPQRDYLMMASEGVMAMPFRDGISGGILPIHTHFYEFIPAEAVDQSSPPTLLAHEVEAGESYVVVLTTSAGLYRYNIGDVVRVRDFHGSTPVLEFLHRTGHTSSLTGEKLTEGQVAAAVCEMGTRFGLTIKGFTLCPVTRPFPHYVLLAEVESHLSAGEGRAFVAAVDEELGIRNLEYRSKRKSRRLGSPELWLVAPGSYDSLRQQRTTQGANDAQVKVACLTRDLEWHNQFQVVDRLSCESPV